jgi:transposase
MLGALDICGVRALMTVKGGTDAEAFEACLERVLLPKLRPGDIVILDNVGAQKPKTVRRLIAVAGASLILLLPYSPDLNPIELAWSKLKAR